MQMNGSSRLEHCLYPVFEIVSVWFGWLVSLWPSSSTLAAAVAATAADADAAAADVCTITPPAFDD